jgi:hypothetical protein
MSKIQPLFTWRSAISSAAGPKSSTTRHVLLALSLYMNEKGESCFPSGLTIATDTGLTERAVRKHLKIASESGWIEISKHGLAGQNWARNEYKATIPKNYHQSMKAFNESQEKKLHYGQIPKTENASKNQKDGAVRRVGSAKSSGKIKQQPCLVCGEEKTQAHHYDYQKKLDVFWLCYGHHRQLHAMEKKGLFAFDFKQKAMNEVHDVNGKGHEPRSEGHERGSGRSGTSFRKVMNHVHTNTPYNSSKNSPERAPAREGERELSIVDRLGQAETYQDCLAIWSAYRRSKGKHMALYETDVFLNKTVKGRSVLEVKKAILHSIEHGWYKLVFPGDDESQAAGAKQIKEFSAEEYLASN